MAELLKDFFDGTEGEFITSKEAHAKQERFLQKSTREGNKNPIRAEFFGKELLFSLLKKDGAMGLRFYQGLSEDGAPSLIVTAVNKEMKNIVKDQTALKDMPAGDGDFGGNGPLCPENC
jgi:hypothetical protein